MIFGLMMLYAGMGAARANRTRDVLDVWARAFSRGVTPEALTVEPLVWVESDDQAGPVWITELVEASRAFRRSIAEGQLREAQQGDREYILSTDEGFRVNISGEADSWLNTVIAAQDTAAWVGVDGAYWLVHLQDPAPGEARVDALMLDSHAMDELSRILRVDLQVRTFEQSSEGEERPEAEGAEVAGPSGIEGRPVLKGVYQPREEGAEETWWNQSRYFGGAWIPAPSLRGRSIREDYMMVTLKTDFLSLGREFISQNNEFNKVIIVILATLALLFMFMQLVAMVFSLRITGGIVDGVRILHKGTQRLARGDLDAHIEIPNEDEFGDLAASFNEMTLAVKQGREDALARERLQNEMETARQIQARLLPHAEPLLPGWEVTGLSIPSRQVGGDYFDFLHPGDGKLGVAIGDVSGKGMPAALLMSNLQASLKGQLMHPAPVSDVVRRMNDLLTESTDSHMFATFFYGEIDGLTGHFTSTNAGHNPPLLVRADGEMEWLDADGLILGMLGEQAYEQVEGDLNPGDILVLYTDGITEAGAPELEDSLDELPDDFEDVDDNEVMFGEERLAEVVVRNRERSAMGVREAILSAVTKFVDGGPQGDDITLVVVKRKEI